MKKKLAKAPTKAAAKKKRSPAGSTPAGGGFFSTDVDIPRRRARMTTRARREYAQAMAETLPRSFQREVKKDVVVKKGEAHDQSIAEVKATAMTQGFIPEHQVEYYAGQGFIGWQMSAILGQNWLIDKVCSMPGRDATRNGWERSVNRSQKLKPEVFDELRRLDKKFKVRKNLIEHMRFARIFGVRHTLFLVDSKEKDYYEHPFNLDGVTPDSYRGMTQIDPYWMAPEFDAKDISDPEDPNFYEPTYWRVQGKRIHRSHFVISRNMSELADILKPSYYYGGVPTTQKIYERIYAAERTANEAPLLAMTKRMITLSMDTAQAMTDFDKLNEKMDLWSRYMNNFGIRVVGENEEVNLFDTALAGLDETIMTQYQLVAAAGDIPATKILGTSPKGFGATGEYEESSYHEFLETLQEHELSPVMERHDQLVMKSVIQPMLGTKEDINLETEWNAVDAMTRKTRAEVNERKANADRAYVDMGAITGQEVRDRLIKDRDSGYDGLTAQAPEVPEDEEGGEGEGGNSNAEKA